MLFLRRTNINLPLVNFNKTLTKARPAPFSPAVPLKLAVIRGNFWFVVLSYPNQCLELLFFISLSSFYKNFAWAINIFNAFDTKFWITEVIILISFLNLLEHHLPVQYFSLEPQYITNNITHLSQLKVNWTKRPPSAMAHVSKLSSKLIARFHINNLQYFEY